MKKTRLTALILSLLMTSPSLTSCSSGGTNTDETTPDSASTSIESTPADSDDGTDATGGTAILKDDLPERNYDGADYAIYTRNITSHAPFLVEDLNAEELNDSLYTRQVNIEDRFSVKLIEEVYSDEGLPYTLITAGDQTYSLMNVRCTAAINIASKKYAFPINNLEYIDLDKGYWDSSLTADINVGKTYYFAIGDANIVALDFTNILLYNKKLYADCFGNESIYSLVDEGKWTFDKFGEMGAAATVDLDGNGKLNIKDQFGMLGNAKYLQCSLIPAAGEYYIHKDADNYPIYDMPSNERMVNVVEKIFAVCNENGAWCTSTDTSNEATAAHNMFREGRGLFLATMFQYVETLRDMEDDFGVLPFPKYDENQDGYYTRVSFFDTSIIPVSTPDPERSAIILEALTCESHNLVVPAYYEVCLKSKYARDPDSARMLDILYNTRLIDFGDTYFAANIRDAFVEDSFIAGDATLASQSKKIEKVMNKQIERMSETFEAIENFGNE